MGSDLMRDIGREIGSAGKDILNLSNHMIERDNQLLQLNGNACRFQSRIKILGGDVLMALLTLRRGRCPDGQRSEMIRTINRLITTAIAIRFFQRIEVMEMEING